MTPEFHAYKTFLAVRNHFRNPDYDYFFYNGKSRASEASFLKNKNRFQFQALTKKLKPEQVAEFCAVNFAYTREEVWITSLFSRESHSNYEKFRKYTEASSYFFEEDIKKLLPLKETLTALPDSYPKIIIDTMSDRIHLETLCILDLLYSKKLTAYFDSVITEKYLWPTFRMKYTRFAPFVKFDEEKCKKVLDKLCETK